MEKVKNFCVENSASILTGLGVVGVVSTAILAATATPKALRLGHAMWGHPRQTGHGGEV